MSETPAATSRDQSQSALVSVELPCEEICGGIIQHVRWMDRQERRSVYYYRFHLIKPLPRKDAYARFGASNPVSGEFA